MHHCTVLPTTTINILRCGEMYERGISIKDPFPFLPFYSFWVRIMKSRNTYTISERNSYQWLV